MKKPRGSSARESRVAKKDGATKRRTTDYSDIPELTDDQLSGMRRVGRPSLGGEPRKAISIRIDQRVLAWVKQTAARRDQPYQSFINDILEKAMRRAG